MGVPAAIRRALQLDSVRIRKLRGPTGTPFKLVRTIRTSPQAQRGAATAHVTPRQVAVVALAALPGTDDCSLPRSVQHADVHLCDDAVATVRSSSGEYAGPATRLHRRPVMIGRRPTSTSSVSRWACSRSRPGHCWLAGLDGGIAWLASLPAAGVIRAAVGHRRQRVPSRHRRKMSRTTSSTWTSSTRISKPTTDAADDTRRSSAARRSPRAHGHFAAIQALRMSSN